jgi:predicted transposase/invertase (TIGR01784 family)
MKCGDKREEMKMLTKKSPQMKKAVGILMELSEDERVRMLAEKREWARRDQVALIDDALEEGLAKGKAEGLAEGKAEGKAEGERSKALAIAKKMLDMGMPVAEIADITGLTIEEIGALQEPK